MYHSILMSDPSRCSNQLLAAFVQRIVQALKARLVTSEETAA
jgi:hypothetical protein